MDLIQHKQLQQLQQSGEEHQGVLTEPWFRVKVEGPYGEVVAPVAPAEGEPLVFIAGGIGATAALSVMAEMQDQQEQQQRKRPALLVWACRHPGEFPLVGPPLLELAERKGLELRCHLHYTGESWTACGNGLGEWGIERGGGEGERMVFGRN